MHAYHKTCHSLHLARNTGWAMREHLADEWDIGAALAEAEAVAALGGPLGGYGIGIAAALAHACVAAAAGVAAARLIR